MSIIIWKISSSSTFKGRRAANHNLVAKHTIQIHSYILRTYDINSSSECLLSGDLSWGATIYKHKIHTFSVWFGIFSICVNFCMGEGSVLAFFYCFISLFSLWSRLCFFCVCPPLRRRQCGFFIANSVSQLFVEEIMWEFFRVNLLRTHNQGSDIN